jgi:hypothetical protein
MSASNLIRQDSVMVVIPVVIVIIPIAFRAPPALVFIPPSVIGSPATLPRCAQVTTRAFCLSAAVAIACDRSIESVVGAGNAPLAIVGTHKWGCGKH